MVPCLVEARALGLDFLFVPGATPKKPFSGLTAQRRSVRSLAHPGDIVADRPDLVALFTEDFGRNKHGKVGLTAGRREGSRDIADLSVGALESENEHMLGHPTLESCPDMRLCEEQSTFYRAIRFRRSRS